MDNLSMQTYRIVSETNSVEMKILGMEQLGPNHMSPVFLLLYEPKTNFPLETLKEALLRTGLSYSGK